MIGQLQDAGNTTTLAHYLDLLSGAGMVTGIQKYSGSRVRLRGSTPKLQVFNTALLIALSGMTPAQVEADSAFKGRLVESAVGAHLANAAASGGFDLFYWRQGNLEVDFVIKSGKWITAIEVKSGRRRETLSGMEAFVREFNPNRRLLIGADGIGLEKFLSEPCGHWAHP